MADISTADVVAQALDALEAREAAKARAAAEDAAKREAMRVELRKELEAERKAWLDAKEPPVVMKEATPGFDEKEQNGAFIYWMRTGDLGAAKSLIPALAIDAPDGSKKDMAEASGTGAYLFPVDFTNRIIEKRDNASFVRAMGVNIRTTNLLVVDLPAEDTLLTKFTRVAEAGAYSTNDPTYAQNRVTVDKWTKVTTFSEESLADAGAGLEQNYIAQLARAMAQTEAYYVANGSGTSQHEGIFIGGTTDGQVFDSTTNITPDEIYELAMKLKTGYQDGACWLMDNDTWRYLITLRDTSEWAFNVADMATLNTAGGPQAGTLYGKPVFLQDDIAVRATKAQVIAYGHPFAYTLVERAGLTIARNPYLYQANGQVAFFSSFRQSGKVTIKEAWQLAYMA